MVDQNLMYFGGSCFQANLLGLYMGLSNEDVGLLALRGIPQFMVITNAGGQR
jgi:hypothetical protein